MVLRCITVNLVPSPFRGESSLLNPRSQFINNFKVSGAIRFCSLNFKIFAKISFNFLFRKNVAYHYMIIKNAGFL